MMTGQIRPPPPAAEKEVVVPQTEVDSEADLQAAWKDFDPTLRGSITAAQFRQVMASLGENVSDLEVDEIIRSVDGGQDKISCESALYISNLLLSKRTRISPTYYLI